MQSLFRLYLDWRNWTKKKAKNQSRAKARSIKKKIKYCELCGKQGLLEVHHINGNPLDNRLKNLAKICLPCHIKQHEHEHVAHLMRQRTIEPKKIDRGPVIRFLKRLIRG